MRNDVYINNLSYIYENSFKMERIKALDGISFCVENGESVGIIGANGAGKTTLFRIITGLLSGYEGEMKICGMELCRKNLTQVRKRVGYVFQESDNQLFMTTAFENAAFGPRNYGKSKDETDIIVKEAFSSVGAENLINRPVSSLSGGEKKLVSIASILAMEPEIVLMDEPSVSLDPKNRRHLIGVLNGIHKTKLIASHDLDLILETCERTILISDGKVIGDGVTKEVLTNERMLKEHGMELPLCMQKPVYKKFCKGMEMNY